jgi:hypothetical protein
VAPPEPDAPPELGAPLEPEPDTPPAPPAGAGHAGAATPVPPGEMAGPPVRTDEGGDAVTPFGLTVPRAAVGGTVEHGNGGQTAFSCADAELMVAPAPAVPAGQIEHPDWGSAPAWTPSWSARDASTFPAELRSVSVPTLLP